MNVKTIRNSIQTQKKDANLIYKPNCEVTCFIGGVPITLSDSDVLAEAQKSLPKIGFQSVKLIYQKNKEGFNKGFGFVILKTEKDRDQFMESGLIINSQKVIFSTN